MVHRLQVHNTASTLWSGTGSRCPSRPTTSTSAVAASIRLRASSTLRPDGSTASSRVTPAGRNGRLCPVPNPISSTSPSRSAHTRARILRVCLVSSTTLTRCGRMRSPSHPIATSFRVVVRSVVVQQQDEERGDDRGDYHDAGDDWAAAVRAVAVVLDLDSDSAVADGAVGDGDGADQDEQPARGDGRAPAATAELGQPEADHHDGHRGPQPGEVGALVGEMNARAAAGGRAVITHRPDRTYPHCCARAIAKGFATKPRCVVPPIWL